MNVEEFRDYCLAKPGVTDGFPFGPDVLVIKVMNKMFAATSLSEEAFRVNLKCDPELAVELREQYPAVIPGWHMNKKHWNTVYFDGSVDHASLCEWIDHSYDLVVASLKKADREALRDLSN